MSNVIDLLDRPLYDMSDVDRMLHLTKGTARRWIDGYKRAGRFYDPVIRPRHTGKDVANWGEFVEARLLSGFRDQKVHMLKLRPAVEQLRRRYKTRYPLAHAVPLLTVQGKELLYRLQDEFHPDVPLVERINDGQLVLTDPVQEFITSADFDSTRGQTVVRLHDMATRSVVMDPLVRFGEPQIDGVPTDVLAELARAGDSKDQLAEWYELPIEQINEALLYEGVNVTDDVA